MSDDDFEVIEVNWPLAHSDSASTKEVVQLTSFGSGRCRGTALKAHMETMKHSPLVVPAEPSATS